MLDKLTSTDFSDLLNQHFQVGLESGPLIETELVSVTMLGHGTAKAQTADAREPFSLLFRGPLTPILPQQIYQFDHPSLGNFPLFIVPVGPDGVGMRYEAIFT
jgi:hypothetical protein